MRKFISAVKNESGAALMLAIFTVVMLTIIATEVMYETSVEFVVSSQSVNQVRAHYAAKAGVEVSLLRLHIYRKAIAALGDTAKQLPMLDMIWQMPFSWPPTLPQDLSTIEKEEINASVKASYMEGQYVTTIESESSKIDLSLLALENNEALVNQTIEQLLGIFQSKLEGDEEFANKYSGYDFARLINNIKDWIDPDNVQSGNQGGDEQSLYTHLNTESVKFPPNQPFKTFEELHMVDGMTDEFFNILLPRVTIYGAKAINVKYASRDVLKAAFGLTDDQVDRLMEERGREDTQIMKDANSFLEYVASLGVRRENLFDARSGKPRINILVEPEFNFRIISTGVSGKVQRTITAIVYDYDRVLAQLKTFSATPTPQPTPPPGGPGGPGGNPPGGAVTPTPTPAQRTPPPPNERPNIVYWNET